MDFAKLFGKIQTVAHFNIIDWTVSEKCPFPVDNIEDNCRGSYGFLAQDEGDYLKGWKTFNESGKIIL